jgi:hypothetical protein
LSCEKAREDYDAAREAHATAVQRLKRQERMMFARTSPAAILLSDQDLEVMRRLETEEEEAARLEREKALAYEEAKRSHLAE